MKKLLFLLVMCSLLTFVSCKKDTDETPTKFMTATINGDAFEAATVIAILDSSFGDDLIISSGTNEDGTFNIGLNIPTDIQVNDTIPIDEFDFGITFTDPDDNAFFTVGTVKLTTNDTVAKEMEGAFNFTATDDENDTNVYEITDGAFRFTY